MKYFLFLFVLTFTAQAQDVDSGTLKHHTDFKSEFVAARNVYVWLPNGYSDKEKYAVLYMHDGQMLFDKTTTWNKQEWQIDEVGGELLRQEAAKPFIVVGISSIAKLRHSDYFPQKPFESLPQKTQDSLYGLKRGNEKLFGEKINSDNYLKFIVKELKPFIDKTYSVQTDRNNTFIAGSSMGGLVSMYAICEYPDIFGGAACISTHWPGVMESKNLNPVPKAFMDYMKKNLPDPRTHKIYFDYGGQTLDAVYEPFQKQADEIMKNKGYDQTNWLTRSFPDFDHSENSWAARIDIPLMFLLAK